MSTYTIEVDDSVITEKILEIINTIFTREMRYKYTNTGDVIAQAVKELVYSRKDEIIEMVVKRASREITKKALPKLLEMGVSNEIDK